MADENVEDQVRNNGAGHNTSGPLPQQAPPLQQENTFGFHIPRLEIFIGATGKLPATLATVGTVCLAGYVVYNIFNNERIVNAFVERIDGNSIEVDMMTGDKNTAKDILRLICSGRLLCLMNNELQNIVGKEKDGTYQYMLVELISYQVKNMNKTEFESKKTDARVLRQEIISKFQKTDHEQPTGMPEKIMEIEKKRALDQGLKQENKDKAGFTEDDKSEKDLPKIFKVVLDLADIVKQEYSITPGEAFVSFGILAVLQAYTGFIYSCAFAETEREVRRLSNLFVTTAPRSAEECFQLADLFCAKGMFVEAMCFYEVAAEIYNGWEGNAAAAFGALGILNCVRALLSISSYMVNLKGSSKELRLRKNLIKYYIIPSMTKMSDQLGKMKLDDEKYIEAAIWCLHYTECVMGLIEDWEARKNKIEEGIDLMKESGFGEKAKIEQWIKQKFKNEQRTDEEAKMEEEIDEEVKMEEEVNTEEGIDLKKIEDKAERGSLLEHFQYNLLCTLKKITEMPTHLTRLF